MSDISNKTLAIFLLTATIVSFGGFLLTLNHLDGITGRAATDTGNANFSINSSISVVFTQNLVDFGAGLVNGSGFHNCTLNTTGPGMANGAFTPNANDCFGFNSNVLPLRVQNQGTQNVTLNISFNATNAQFVGGTTPSFTFRATYNETGACGNVTGLFLNNIMQEISSANTNYSICNSTMFDWHTNNRTLNLDLGVKIPQDTPQGVHKVVITAYASTP